MIERPCGLLILADAVLHRTGHGAGLEIHEPPYITEGNPAPLEIAPAQREPAPPPTGALITRFPRRRVIHA